MAVLDVGERRAGHVASGAFLSDGMQDKTAVQRGRSKTRNAWMWCVTRAVGTQESQAPGRRWHWDPPWTVHSPARNRPFAVGRSRNVSLEQRRATARELMLVHTLAGVLAGRNNRRLSVRYPIHTVLIRMRETKVHGIVYTSCTGGLVGGLALAASVAPEGQRGTNKHDTICGSAVQFALAPLSRQPTLRLPGFIFMRL